MNGCVTLNNGSLSMLRQPQDLNPVGLVKPVIPAPTTPVIPAPTTPVIPACFWLESSVFHAESGGAMPVTARPRLADRCSYQVPGRGAGNRMRFGPSGLKTLDACVTPGFSALRPSGCTSCIQNRPRRFCRRHDENIPDSERALAGTTMLRTAVCLGRHDAPMPNSSTVARGSRVRGTLTRPGGA